MRKLAVGKSPVLFVTLCLQALTLHPILDPRLHKIPFIFRQMQAWCDCETCSSVSPTPRQIPRPPRLARVHWLVFSMTDVSPPPAVVDAEGCWWAFTSWVIMSLTGWATYQSGQSGVPPIDLPLLPNLAETTAPWEFGGEGSAAGLRGCFFQLSTDVCQFVQNHQGTRNILQPNNKSLGTYLTVLYVSC